MLVICARFLGTQLGRLMANFIQVFFQKSVYRRSFDFSNSSVCSIAMRLFGLMLTVLFLGEKTLDELSQILNKVRNSKLLPADSSDISRTVVAIP